MFKIVGKCQNGHFYFKGGRMTKNELINSSKVNLKLFISIFINSNNISLHFKQKCSNRVNGD